MKNETKRNSRAYTGRSRQWISELKRRGDIKTYNQYFMLAILAKHKIEDPQELEGPIALKNIIKKA